MQYAALTLFSGDHVKRMKNALGIVLAATVIALSVAPVTPAAPGPVPPTAVAAIASPTATAVAVATPAAAQRMTPTEMDVTVGGLWGWLSDFVEGVKEGGLTAIVVVVIIVVLG